MNEALRAVQEAGGAIPPALAGKRYVPIVEADGVWGYDTWHLDPAMIRRRWQEGVAIGARAVLQLRP